MVFVMEVHGHAGLGKDLGDPATHETGADDTYLLDFHFTSFPSTFL
jgi:hypothetical protein